MQRSGESGKQWKSLCPGHDDSEASLMIGIGDEDRVLLKCLAGCAIEKIVAGMGLEMNDLRVAKAAKISLAQLAEAKKLPADWLARECGLRDESYGVGIPYHDVNHKRLFVRRRVALLGKRHTLQPSGVGVQAYGQWRLGDAKKAGELVIVEGESDALTLWFHGFHALGLPGVGTTKSLQTEFVQGLKAVYVWQEHGEGGENFVKLVGEKLKKAGVVGAKLLRSQTHKDPSDMHMSNVAGFGEAMRAMMGAAVALPEGRSGRARPIPGEIAAAAAATAATASAPKLAGTTGTSAAAGAAPPSGQPLGEEIPVQQAGWFAATDTGNAQRLVHRHGRNIRWVRPWKAWLGWDGVRWVQDSEAMVVRAAIETVRSIYTEASSVEDAMIRQRLSDHAHNSESRQALSAMIDLARSQTGITIEPDVLDRNHWLFNCANGTVELTSGTLRAARREDMISKVCDVKYDPKAECAEWTRVLGQVFDGRESLISYMKRLAGYCLTGDISANMLIVCWGDGGNGKSTIINTLTKVMGRHYAGPAAADLLTINRGEHHPVELANLFGKRLVICQETQYGCRLNETLVKQLTGGDEVSARRMRENPWEFMPTHKLVLCTNYRPSIRGSDNGIWRRLRLIPFTVTFSGDNEDKGLPMRLLEEVGGILAWMVNGCVEWQNGGEQVPAEVTLATEEYHEDEDTVGKFLSEECATCKEDKALEVERTQSSALYDAYVAWSDRNREFRVPSKYFRPRLEKLGFGFRKIGVIWVYGIIMRNKHTAKTVSGDGNGVLHGGNGVLPSDTNSFDLSSLD